MTALSLEPDGHATTPPPRYTEPTLVKALEDRGIGRPSTYAAILSTILDRGYVFKKGTALVPSFVAFSVVNLLEGHFEQLVDFDFTARMEDDLDRIAAGDEERVAVAARGSTSATATATPASITSSPRSSTRSTRARSTRSRSRAARPSSASAATARTSSEARSARASRPTSRPTS